MQIYMRLPYSSGGLAWQSMLNPIRPVDESDVITKQWLIPENIEGITRHYTNHRSGGRLLEVRGRNRQDKDRQL